MQPKGIKEIYHEYFKIIDDYFGSIKGYLGPDDDSHIELGLKMASYPLISDLIFDATEDIDKAIENFWHANLGDLLVHVKQQDCLKCVYSGDISPPILESFVKKSALYIDTVIIPDPIYNLACFQKQLVQDNRYYLNKLVRNVFNVWKLKDLVLADTKERILLILPINLDFVKSEDRNRLIKTAETRFISYAGSLFGREFADKESCFEYLSLQKSSKDIFENIKCYDILPNEFKKLETLDGFLNNLYATRKYAKIPIDTIGDSFGIYISAQFIRVQEHKFMCQRLNAEPIYDSQLPWFFFNYEMGGLDMDATIASALQQEKFELLTRVPLQALRKLREENKLEYMRSVIRRGITDLKAKKDKDLLVVSAIIQKNIQEELCRHAAEMNDLKKEVSIITKKEIPISAGSYLVGVIPYYGFIVSLPFVLRDIVRLLGQKKRIEKIIEEKERGYINLLMKSDE